MDKYAEQAQDFLNKYWKLTLSAHLHQTGKNYQVKEGASQCPPWYEDKTVTSLGTLRYVVTLSGAGWVVRKCPNRKPGMGQKWSPKA